MDTFNVNISVNDCCSSKCCNNNISTTTIITSLTNFIVLQNNYYLKIIAVNDNSVVLSIDNGNIFFVRRAFVGIPIKIRIPNNCSCHIVTIVINSIT